MHGKFGAEGAQSAGASEAADARSMALELMSGALAQLDSDCTIPPVIGAQLQTAIDTLLASLSRGQSSTDLH